MNIVALRENDVYLVISGDPSFQGTMTNVQNLGIKLYLARPAGAKSFAGFGVGIAGVWELEDLLSGKLHN